MDSRRRQRSISPSQPQSTTPDPSQFGVPTRLPDALGCRPSAAGGQGATLSTFPQVPLTREPTCTQAIDPGTSGSALTPADTSRPCRSSGYFPNFPWPGSPWLAHGSPLRGDWFPNPTGLLLSILRLPSFPGSQPCDVPFPCATSRHPSWPIPRASGLPILLGLLCAPGHTLFSVPSPSPFLLCFYPTGPPATLWRGPTGSSSIRGPFRAPSTGCSLPAPVPVPCAMSRHPSRPPPRAPRLPILLWLLCGPSHTPFSVPSPFPIISCSYPNGPPATLRRGPTGSSSIWGPFRAPSTGRSLPSPFRLGGVFFLDLLGALFPGPAPGTCAFFPSGHLRFGFFFFCAPPVAPLLHRLLLPVPPRPNRSVVFALRRCLWFSFLVCPPPLSRSASCLVVPSSLHARTSALHWSSGHGSPLWSSPVPSPSWGVPVGGPRPCQVGAPPWRPSPLFPLFSPPPSPPPPLSLAGPLTAALLHRALSAGLPRARAVSRALSRPSRPPPCPPSCRPTWAASPDTPSGGFPHRPSPPASPPSAP